MRVIYREDLERVYEILNRVATEDGHRYNRTKAQDLLGRLIDEAAPQADFRCTWVANEELKKETDSYARALKATDEALETVKKGLAENERKIKSLRAERNAQGERADLLSAHIDIIRKERDLYCNMAADADVLREKLSEAEKKIQQQEVQLRVGAGWHEAACERLNKLNEAEAQIVGLQRAYDDLAKTKDYAEVDVMALVKRVERLEMYVCVPPNWAAKG